MRALVTGGGGFLGSAIVHELLGRGDDVRVFARGDYPALRDAGAETVRGDLTDPTAAHAAVRDCDVVFHVAAKAGAWGPYAEFYDANVTATAHLLGACRAAGVGRLVYTSTPSVVHAGGDITGADESLPYATRYLSPYPQTKAIAERAVLQANDAHLATVALRPRLIWGPGDTQLVPRILARGRAGQLRLIGGGNSRLDTTYITDAAHAHVLAADALQSGAACAGRAYFISSGDPQPVRVLLNGILAAGGLPPVTSSVPYPVAYAAASLAELAGRLLRRREEPVLTRMAVRQLATDSWFDISAARRDFGYAPQMSVAEGLEALAESLHVAARRDAG